MKTDKYQTGIKKISLKEVFIIALLLFSEYRKVISSTVGIVFFVVFLALLFLIAYHKEILNLTKLKLSKNAKLILLFPILNILLILLQLFFVDFQYAALKRIIANVALIAMVFTFHENEFNSFQKVVKLMSLFLVIDMLIKLPIILSSNSLYAEIRYYTILDKAFYTFWISLFNVITFSEIINRPEKKHIWKIIILILVDLLMLLFMEVKTLILVFAILLLIRYHKISQKKKYLVIAIILPILLFVFLLFEYIMPYLPEHISNLIKFVKYGLNGLQNTGNARTYFIRTAIIQNCIHLIQSHPFGIGFGNYYYYAINVSAPSLGSMIIAETESSYLNLIVEGGILAFVIDLIFMFKLIRMAYQNKNYDSQLIFSILIVLVLLNIINDFMTLSYWFILGCIIPKLLKQENEIERK